MTQLTVTSDHHQDPASLDIVIAPRARDIGGFEVRRALPYAKRRMVGPFIFFDQMGPASFAAGKGIDVRPHPHIGLGTVTYLFEGKIHHKDSLGSALDIEPGAVNWMIAGKGITHSERSPDDFRAADSAPLSGIQTWLALPQDREDMAPAFYHHSKDELPTLEAEGKKLRLILGDAYGEKAPVNTQSDVFYLDACLEAGAQLPLPDNHEERGVYVVEGEVQSAGDIFGEGKMLIYRPGDRLSIKAGAHGARVMLFGGAALEGPRFIWWNLVSSSQEKIEQAKEEWKQGKWGEGLFSLPPGDDQEFIPLPDA
ncbi:pirin family protein [Parvularcula sp. IMCC14364]|uniref:pirin family protein n=1 Tax=Parvularcula sp. IMCC14364 TaxID=3067902 RepID=UPI0027407450|nr:pirin family protein [Parvularcula sp. IMCC14364]